jgi:hypothetical protein
MGIQLLQEISQGSFSHPLSFKKHPLTSLHSVNLPRFTDMTEGFHINSTTTSVFNCTRFDQLFTTSSTSSHYSCFASLPGSTTDTALHYSTPSSSPLLPKPAKVVIIIISVIIGIAPISCLLRCYSRRNSTLREEREAMELEEARRASQNSEDKLPPYRRVGNPGEVPPGYVAPAPPGYEEVVRRPERVANAVWGARSRTRLRGLWPRFAG